jgi:hypothetical protein
VGGGGAYLAVKLLVVGQLGPAKHGICYRLTRQEKWKITTWRRHRFSRQHIREACSWIIRVKPTWWQQHRIIPPHCALQKYSKCVLFLSSGQSSWLHIRRPGFDSRHYQKKKVVGLERGPLSLVSTTQTMEFNFSLSPRANYTYRATAACWRSYCQLLRIEGVTWSAWRIPTAVLSVFWTGAATFLSSSSSVVLTRLGAVKLD